MYIEMVTCTAKIYVRALGTGWNLEDYKWVNIVFSTTN